jgi:hypothetical protein
MEAAKTDRNLLVTHRRLDPFVPHCFSNAVWRDWNIRMRCSCGPLATSAGIKRIFRTFGADSVIDFRCPKIILALLKNRYQRHKQRINLATTLE